MHGLIVACATITIFFGQTVHDACAAGIAAVQYTMHRNFIAGIVVSVVVDNESLLPHHPPVPLVRNRLAVGELTRLHPSDIPTARPLLPLWFSCCTVVTDSNI
jgi:hypothetical protein